MKKKGKKPKGAKFGLLIKVDGTIQPIFPKEGTKFSLEELQGYVGGLVERVQLPDRSGVMLANEEGHPLGLQTNVEASAIAGRRIVGDVVLLQFGMGWR